MERLDPDEIRDAVRRSYAKSAGHGGASCSCSPTASCCGSGSDDTDNLAKLMGYSENELKNTPQGSNMGFGCGNPQTIAKLKHGEVVLDLGSGGGFDCFLAAQQVGDGGRVIGVDMTAEMIYKARENAKKGGFKNVEFRLGEIENLPVADESVDVIMSNCVVNLSPDKPRVFQEAYRTLKAGGRISLADTVAVAPLPLDMQSDPMLLSGCLAGAATVDEIEQMLNEAGFQNIQIQLKTESRELIRRWLPDSNIDDHILSATIEAVKPVND